MDDLKTKTANLKEHVSGYVNSYSQLLKLKATKGASNAAAGIAIGVSVFFLLLFFLIFAFTGLAWWLASVFNSAALGFFAVAAIFLILIIIIIALRKNVIVPAIRNAIISKVYDKED